MPVPFLVIELLIEGEDSEGIDAIAEEAARLANEVAERRPCEVRIVALTSEKAERWNELLNE